MGIDRQKVGTIAYMAVMVFYGVYTMVLSILAYTKFSDTTQNYLNIASNLSQPFIVDMQVSTTTCPSGYTSIFDWDWKGAYSGCDCRSSSYSTNHRQLYRGSCNSTEVKKGCVYYNPIGEVQFTAIEGLTNQKQIVCKKQGTVKFSDIAADQKGVCSSSQKLCGNPSKKETIICVSANEPCPIYEFKRSKIVDTATYPPSDWNQYALANGQYLYVNVKGSSASALPISEVRFTQSGVCKLENTAKHLPEGASDYDLLKTTRNECSETDDTFKLADFEVPENTYYKLNVPASSWAEMLKWKQFYVPKSTEPFLSYYRPFINWKIENRADIKPLADAADSIRGLKKAQLAVMIINIIVCLSVSIILQISQVYNLCGKDVPCIEGVGSSEQKRIVFIKKILTYGSKLLQAPFLLWAFIVSTQKKDLIAEASNAQSSDPRFNSELAAFADQIDVDVYKRNMIALIILLLTVLLDLVIFLKNRYWTECQGSRAVAVQINPALQNEVDEKENLGKINSSSGQQGLNQSSCNPDLSNNFQNYPQQDVSGFQTPYHQQEIPTNSPYPAQQVQAQTYPIVVQQSYPNQVIVTVHQPQPPPLVSQVVELQPAVVVQPLQATAVPVVLQTQSLTQVIASPQAQTEYQQLYYGEEAHGNNAGENNEDRL